MDLVKSKTRLAGFLFLAGMFAGILSVAPSVDSANFLTEAAANSGQVIIAAAFQFMMSLAYLGIAILLYPLIRRFGSSLSIGFLSLRIIAAGLVILGALLLLSVLALSQEFVKNAAQDTLALEALGNVFKTTRDYINHVFMILVLCTGNFMFYILLLRSKLIPRWLSVWGLFGNVLSAIASVLVLFQLVEIITTEYLVLNVPTALQELVLGFWLMVKCFDKRPLENKEQNKKNDSLQAV